MSDVYENIPVHLVPYSCDNLVANAKKAPKNDDTSCTHKGERKRSHHRFCCTLVTPMRDPDRLDEIIFATYLMPIFTKLSKSTQSNSPSTQEIRSKWLIPFQLVTLHDLHPQSRQLNLNSPTRVQHPKTYIYTNIFPTIFTNTTLKKITTDSTHPWPFFFCLVGN